MSKNKLKGFLENLRLRSKGTTETKPQIPLEWVEPQDQNQEVKETTPVASKPVFIFPKVKPIKRHQIPFSLKRILAFSLFLITLFSLFGASSPTTLAFYLASLIPPLDYLLKTHKRKSMVHWYVLPDIEKLEVE